MEAARPLTPEEIKKADVRPATPTQKKIALIAEVIKDVKVGEGYVFSGIANIRIAKEVLRYVGKASIELGWDIGKSTSGQRKKPYKNWFVPKEGEGPYSLFIVRLG
jgi:hypothetical protein